MIDHDINKIKHQKLLDNRAKIVEMYNSHKTLKEIAEAMGVSTTTIYYHLVDEHDVIRRRRKIIKRGIKRNDIISEKELKPFMQRISPKLRAQIKQNTEINNARIKMYGHAVNTDSELINNIICMKITDLVKG